MRTLVQGGLVVRHDGVRRADVLFEDERIVEVGEGLSASGACVVDATDCYVLPGGVDAQVRPAGAGLGGLARPAIKPLRHTVRVPAGVAPHIEDQQGRVGVLPAAGGKPRQLFLLFRRVGGHIAGLQRWDALVFALRKQK